LASTQNSEEPYEFVDPFEPIPHYWNFDTGMGDWQNNATGDTHNWTRDNAGTPSTGTGPSVDHTLQTSSGYYMYLETSDGGGAFVNGNNAILTGPWFTPTDKGAQFIFYYHMYGADMGTLRVQLQQAEESWATIWSKAGQQHGSSGAAWSLAVVNLDDYRNKLIRLRFEGIAAGGWMGDMAIDHIALVYDWADSDGDGLPDIDEITMHRTDPNDDDTDGDGLPDGWEVEYGFNPLVTTPDLNDDTTDSDGATLLQEGQNGTNPYKKDHWQIALEVF
jgi:hypothetical protein